MHTLFFYVPLFVSALAWGVRAMPDPPFNLTAFALTYTAQELDFASQTSSYPGKSLGTHCLDTVKPYPMPRDHYEVDRLGLLNQLRYFNRSVLRFASSPLDLELLSGSYLKCGIGEVEIRYRSLARRFDTCEGVIVTSNYGGKDHVRDIHPKVLEETAEQRNNGSMCFVYFVDDATSEVVNETIASGHVYHWNFVRIRSAWFMHIGSRAGSRIPKMLLPRLFPYAKWSIWVDSKLHLKVHPQIVLNEMNLGTGAFEGMFMHDKRITWAEEAWEVIKRGFLEQSVFDSQVEQYKAAGFSVKNAGLLEGGVIVRDHHHIMSHVQACMWWEEYLTYPPRDQTTFPFVNYVIGYRPILTDEQLENVRKTLRDLERLWYLWFSPFTKAPIHSTPICRRKQLFDFYDHLPANMTTNVIVPTVFRVGPQIEQDQGLDLLGPMPLKRRRARRVRRARAMR